MTHPAFELKSGLIGGEQPADQMGLVGELGAQFSLVVEVISQTEGIALIGFEEANGTLLDWHHIHREVEFLEVLH